MSERKLQQNNDVPELLDERDKQLQDGMLFALHQKEFFIVLQPKFSLPERAIVGAEVLLRWNEPDGGIIFPAEFISAAERAGLVELLDLYALEEACLCLRSWIDNKKPIVPLSINLSSPSLHTPGFVNAVNDCVTRHRIPHEYIEFEFSTQFMRAYPEELARTVTYFHDLGYRCAIDGFAHGPGTLPHVRAFEVDTLKLDCRSFAKDDEEAGVNGCVETYGATRKMDMQVLCEGVETPYQLKALSDAQCRYMQGYALSMPVSTRMFARMLLKNGAA